MNSATAHLRDAIHERTAKIGVLGLGYVGLPLCVEFARKGFAVTGFDVNKEVVDALRRGRSHVSDIPAQVLREVLRTKRFHPSNRFDELSGQDAIIICVPTPLRKSKEPDVSYIVTAASQIFHRLKKGQLIILESTTYPGTTRELVQPMLEEGGLKAGRDFHLAFSPERVDPGNKTYRIANTPKVVGGISPDSIRLAAELYGQIVETVVPVSSAEAAEMVKLLENTFRAVNIGLVNEIAMMCHKLGLDVWEIIGAAATKPFGFMPFQPGPGIGGHCIPLDPQYLAWKMKSLNFEPRFIELAGVINSSMPQYVVARMADVLNLRRKALRGSRILVLGVAYKPNVSDVRESPALDVIHLLEERGAVVSYHDPHVPRAHVQEKRYASVPLSAAALRRQDLVAVMTGHRIVDYAWVLKHSRAVFDARNAIPHGPDPKLFRL
ncbi:MAG: nucleotide sugar dehydrogenase [Elusimicrobia bacterium]|nr:nucleotide sugar dehydrogenase [Elusimicrobiota bacterium]